MLGFDLTEDPANASAEYHFFPLSCSQADKITVCSSGHQDPGLTHAHNTHTHARGSQHTDWTNNILPPKKEPLPRGPKKNPRSNDTPSITLSIFLFFCMVRHPPMTHPTTNQHLCEAEKAWQLGNSQRLVFWQEILNNNANAFQRDWLLKFWVKRLEPTRLPKPCKFSAN
jgi:hypothetical protein